MHVPSHPEVGVHISVPRRDESKATDTDDDQHGIEVGHIANQIEDLSVISAMAAAKLARRGIQGPVITLLAEGFQ